MDTPEVLYLAGREHSVACHMLPGARGRNYKHVYYFRATAAGIQPTLSFQDEMTGTRELALVRSLHMFFS